MQNKTCFIVNEELQHRQQLVSRTGILEEVQFAMRSHVDRLSRLDTLSASAEVCLAVPEVPTRT